MAHAKHHVLAFGVFRLDTDRGVLLNGASEVRLRPKSFGILRYLVERHGQLVSKEELFAAVWRRRVVSDDCLTQCLIDARKAIGDASREAIRTVPRRGYIFTPAVRELRIAESADATVRGGNAERRQFSWLAAAGSGLATAVVVLAIVVYLTRDGPESDGARRAASERPAIAVLPFVDMSRDRDNRYFSEGISEEILNQLASSPDLRVVARSSSFSFKDTHPDIAKIAEKLRVTHVLEGAFRRSGDRVRVTAQLVNTSNSMHVWSGTYDRQLGNVLDVQGEIASAVARSLHLELLDGDTHSRDRDVGIKSYERFLQAQFYFNRRLEGDLERARDHYRQALVDDPDYALAWAGIAGTYFVQTVRGEIVPEIGWPRMGEAVAQALSSNPRLPEAHVRADQYYTYTGDRELAMEHRREALAYGPNSPLVLSRMAADHALRGRFDEAVVLQRRAVALDPLGLIGHVNLAMFLKASGRFDDAGERLQTALALNPSMAAELEAEFGFLLILQDRLDEALQRILEWEAGPDKDQASALIYYRMEQPREADQALESLMRRRDRGTARRVAEVYAYRGETDEAFRWLERPHGHFSAMEHSLYDRWIEDICLSPFLRPLHDDPRWKKLMSENPTPAGPRRGV